MPSKHTTISKKQSKPSDAPREMPPSSPEQSRTMSLGEEAQPWRPHKYQKRAVKFLLEHGAAGLFLDPGLGKTSITLAALVELKRAGILNKALLLAPLRVCHSTWPREIEKWSNFSGLNAVVVHGLKKDKLLAEAENADIVITNYESLPWLLGVTKTEGFTGKTKVNIDLKRWKAHDFDTLIVDELSKFKSSSTSRFKAIKQVLRTFARRWGLTGSPSPNGLMDLFGQVFILDEGRSLGQYITHYRNKFFTPSWDGYSWELNEGADKQIYKRIKPLALTMSASDYLEMPELIENTIKVDLPPTARRVYNELENELYTEINKKTVVAVNAASASTKCRQVANGGVYVDDGILKLVKQPKYKREWLDIHDEKTEAVADLVDELQGEPVLIAYDFEHDLERLKAKLGKNTPHIGGGVTPKRSSEIEKQWNAGKIPVLLGHPASLAHGLNLQGAGRHVVWHSLTWNFELYDQFIRRVYRQGQKSKRVFVHHIIANDTIDEDIISALKSKDKNQRALFDALKNRRKNK